MSLVVRLGTSCAVMWPPACIASLRREARRESDFLVVPVEARAYQYEQLQA
jgi:hypothetical protein